MRCHGLVVSVRPSVRLPHASPPLCVPTLLSPNLHGPAALGPGAIERPPPLPPLPLWLLGPVPQALQSAEQAQRHAEAAARELLSAKKAEVAASALLAGGKNPDPAATEVLKAQAGAKCAEQLKICRCEEDMPRRPPLAHPSSLSTALGGRSMGVR